MNRLLTVVLLTFASPASAAGDPANGQREYARQCAACHIVRTPGGDVLAPGNARTGPNLYGVAGGPVASAGGFRYGDGLASLGRQGMTWSEQDFASYMVDPTGWLREATGDRGARSRMVYRVSDRGAAEDIYAYLESLGG